MVAMQGEVADEDLVFGSIILVVFLICVYAAGRVLSRMKNASFARAWQPLVPIINGKVVEDGGGAATSWLTGNYKGRSVCASMVPDRNRYTGESGFRFNYFDVALLEVSGKSDWSLKERPVTQDKALHQRLQQAGAMNVLTRVGAAEVAYNSRERTLKLIQEPGSTWVPAPVHFEAQLNTLLRLAEINTQINAAVD